MSAILSKACKNTVGSIHPSLSVMDDVLVAIRMGLTLLVTRVIDLNDKREQKHTMLGWNTKYTAVLYQRTLT